MNIIDIVAGIICFILAIFVFLRTGINTTVKYVAVIVLFIVGLIFLISGLRKSKKAE
jgi:putative Mn2+ efflux pump MntP